MSAAGLRSRPYAGAPDLRPMEEVVSDAVRQQLSRSRRRLIKSLDEGEKDD